MKKAKKIFVIIILIIINSTITFFVGKQIGLNTDTSSKTTTITQQIVGTQTISKTLTAVGEVASATTEKLSLNTAKYFKTMCVEEDDIVEKGANILKYSNGTYLKAPYNCVITDISVPETGEICTSNNYLEIKDLENLTTSLSINENEISDISVGKEVQIVLTADESKTYTGEIINLDSIATYSTSGSTFLGTVSFKNDGNIKIGMSVSCTVILEEVKDVVAVPIEAVQTNNDKKYVIVVEENGNTKNVEIETGMSNDSYVEIKSGLNGGETIQIMTTTTQSTIRSNSKNNGSSNSKGQMMMQSGGGSGQFEKPSMSEGQMPQMPTSK